MPNELQKILVELAGKPLNINLGLGDKPINLNLTMPGIKGDNGQDGRNGADGLSSYDIAQLEGFKGSRQEWLDSLKAKVEVNNALTALKRKNIYLPNAQLDTILTKLIELMGNSIDVPVKPLEFDKPLKGQFYINVYGTPHFKVALRGKGAENGVSLGDDGNGRLNLDSPFMADDIELEYFNLLDESIGTYRVAGYAPGNNELAVINEYQFSNDTETINYEFPEVTTVGGNAFHRYVETIKLPKAVRINIGAFNNCTRLKTLEIPSFILKSDNRVSVLDSSDLSILVVNEESDPNVVLNNVNPVAPVTVYNQDRTKKIDKETKTWMPV